MRTNLAEKFNNVIAADIKRDLGLKNMYQIPRLVKVVISAQTGSIKEEKDSIENTQKELSEIVGQKVKINLSRKAVSAFKLRIGQPVGLTATLRGDRMYDFISRLANVALPRVRDFKGLSLKSFDSKGNYCIGISEHVIMPESKYEGNSRVFGFQVNINTSSSNDEHCKILLEKLGFVFEKNN